MTETKSETITRSVETKFWKKNNGAISTLGKVASVYITHRHLQPHRVYLWLHQYIANIDTILSFWILFPKIALGDGPKKSLIRRYPIKWFSDHIFFRKKNIIGFRIRPKYYFYLFMMFTMVLKQKLKKFMPIWNRLLAKIHHIFFV